MKQLLNGTNWYKGNLHLHTTRSDGHVSVEEACEIYQKAGYDFISVTDHRQPSKGGMYENMLLIPGAEWDLGNNIDFPVYHILSVGTESNLELLQYYEEKSLPVGNVVSPQDVIDRINAAGGIAILAHPAWSLMEPADLFEMTGIAAVEVYNSVSAAPWNVGRADSSHYFDLWASKGRLVNCVATDDSHWYTGEHTYSYTMVGADELTADALIEAINAGNAYASQGPLFFSIEYDEKHVHVKCSEDVVRAAVFSNLVWADKRVYDNPHGEFVYDIAEADRYVRIELIDSHGRRAWSRPFSVAE